MNTNVQYVSIIAVGVFLVVLIELVRREKIKERFALMWFMVAAFLLVFSFWRDAIIVLAKIFEIDYAPLVIVPIIIFVGVFVGLYFSYLFSKQSREIKDLTQEMALIKKKLEKKKDNDTEE